MENLQEKEMKKVAGIILISTVLMIILFNTVVFVGTGEVGIVTRFGAVRGRVMQAGINIKVPFIESVKKMNCKIQKIEVENGSASKDMQDVSAKVAVNYSLNTNKALQLFKEVGQKYENIILTPTIMDTVKSVTAEYTAEELITKRTEVTKRMLERLNARFEERGILVHSVNITNFEFSEVFNKAIEDKQVAEQNVKKAQQELEKVKIDSEQKIAQAKAEAESLRLQSQEITEEMIKVKFIEKWNGQLPTTTSEAIPFLNVK